MINPRQLFSSMRNQRLLAIFYVRRDRDLAHAFRAALLEEDGRPNPHGSLILAHLREFCRADISTLTYDTSGRADPIATAMLEGRRDVWNKIAFYLNVDERDLIQIDREYAQRM